MGNKMHARNRDGEHHPRLGKHTRHHDSVPHDDPEMPSLSVQEAAPARTDSVATRESEIAQFSGILGLAEENAMRAAGALTKLRSLAARIRAEEESTARSIEMLERLT